VDIKWKSMISRIQIIRLKRTYTQEEAMSPQLIVRRTNDILLQDLFQCLQYNLLSLWYEQTAMVTSCTETFSIQISLIMVAKVMSRWIGVESVY
jgi:hypothetical protein